MSTITGYERAVKNLEQFGFSKATAEEQYDHYQRVVKLRRDLRGAAWQGTVKPAVDSLDERLTVLIDRYELAVYA